MTDPIEDFIGRAESVVGNHFAGVWLDPDQRMVHVGVAGELDDAVKDLRSSPPGEWTVEVAHVRYSRAELLDIQRQVEARLEYVDGIFSTGVQYEHNRVRVQVGDFASGTVSALAAEFPPGSVHVTTTNAVAFTVEGLPT